MKTRENALGTVSHLEKSDFKKCFYLKFSFSLFCLRFLI